MTLPYLGTGWKDGALDLAFIIICLFYNIEILTSTPVLIINL